MIYTELSTRKVTKMNSSKNKRLDKQPKDVDQQKVTVLFAAVLILLGILLFGSSTRTIKRITALISGKQTLETAQLAHLIDYISENPVRDVVFKVPVYLTSVDKFQFPDLAEACQLQVDHELAKLENLSVNYGFRLINNGFELVDNQDYLLSEEIERDRATDIKLILGENEGIYSDPFDNFAALYLTLNSINDNDVPFFVTQTVLSGIYSDELLVYQQQQTIQPLDSLFKMSHVVPLNVSNYHNNLVKNVTANSPSQNVTFNFVILLEKELLSLDLEIQTLVQNYINSLNIIFQNIYLFDYNILVKNITQYANENSQFWLFNPSSHTMGLNDENTTPIDIAGTFYKEPPIFLDQYATFNFLLLIPSTKHKLRVFWKGQRSSVTTFKSPVDKLISFIESLQYKGDPGEVSQDNSVNSDQLFFIEHDDFKSTFETLLTNLFKALSVPNVPSSNGDKTIVRLDILTRISIVKNLQKLARLLSMLKNDIFALFPEKQLPGDLKQRILISLQLRNRAVQLINRDDKQKNHNNMQALNLLLIANINIKQILIELDKDM